MQVGGGREQARAQRGDQGRAQGARVAEALPTPNKLTRNTRFHAPRGALGSGSGGAISPGVQQSQKVITRLGSAGCELGELVAHGRGIGMGGAQDAGAVGDHLAVESLGFGAAVLPGG